MVRITAAELQKQFGRYAREAQREPVAITHYGQDSLVLISAGEFKRLKALDERRAYFAWELPEDVVRALDEVEIPAEAVQFNHELG